jgi:hypothetical protein
VKIGIVIETDRGGQTALGVPGIAFAERAFGDNHDVEVLGKLECHRQPGDSGTDHQDLRITPTHPRD